VSVHFALFWLHNNNTSFTSLIHCVPYYNNLDIPPDNNGSERAIRNVKIKQKVAGQFKTGQNAFCTIRSVIDTLLKRNLEVLPYLTQIIKLQPVS